MFHLLVKYDGWEKSRDTMAIGRTFEYTSDDVISVFRAKDRVNEDRALAIPALFLSEIGGSGDQLARVGTLTRIRVTGSEYTLDYAFDDDVPPISNSRLQDLSGALDISDFEFSRTHWAVKDVDLFRVLLREQGASAPSPKVFKMDPARNVDAKLLSVMMPFAKAFDGVYGCIQAAAKAVDMACLRADNIWENEEVIQDIFSLINRSRIVVCDFSGRNPNVFYEAGIAHTLGRDVILITQSADDVPFDLKHLRYVPYQDTPEGLRRLQEKLKQRIQSLTSDD